MDYNSRILIIISIMLFSCDTKKKREIIYNTDVKIINIAANDISVEELKMNKKKYTKFLAQKDIEYIPLQTTAESLIGKIDKILFINNNFFILDKKNSKGIFVFDYNGVFLYKIQKLGKGPGEYLKLSDFCYNKKNNQLEIHDTFGKKIIVYDLKGEFIKVEKAVNSQKFFPANENERYFYSKFLPIKDELRLDDNYRLLKANGNGKIIKSFLSFRNETTYKSGITNAYNNFYQNTNSDKILFIETYNNNIYELDDNSIKIKYELNFNNSNIPKDFLESNIEDKYVFVNKNKWAYITNVLFEDDNKLIFWYKKGFGREVVYLKKDETYFECYNYFVENDNIFIRQNISINDQFGISILEPYKLKEQLEKSINLNERMKNLLLSVNDKSNPIIVKVNRSDYEE